ncbi:MAG: hypothetical protein M3Q48_10295, partial [Actinomycetota bacterium]|nr:hypothetical protein [Actinomycetota bacterium]
MRTRALVALAVMLAGTVVPVRTALGAPATRLAVLDEADAAGGDDIGFPATHLGLRWTGEDDAVVEVRWLADGRWQGWQAVTVAHDLEDERRGLVYSGLVRAPNASRVQARVAAGSASDVEVIALDTVNGPRRVVRAAA